METTNAPRFATKGITTKPLATNTRTTNGKVKRKFFAKEPVTLPTHDGSRVFLAGEEIGGKVTAEGLAIANAYGRAIALVLPWEKVAVKYFMTVRETRVTEWEIVRE
jgi:hypothetical protein